MNKIFHSCCYIFLCASLLGQDCVLDSLWTIGWDEETMEWEEMNRTIYSYQNGIGIWQNRSIRTFRYDTDGNETSVTRISMGENGVVGNIRIDSTAYDSYGNLSFRSSLVEEDGEIRAIYKRLYENEYYEDGLLESTTTYYWIETDDLYVFDDKTTFLYDDSDNLICETEERIDELSNELRVWSKIEYQYENGLLISETFLYNYLLSLQLYIDEKIFYLYDDNENLVREEILYFGWGQKVDEHFAYDYVYDSCGPLKEETFSERDFVTNNWQPLDVKRYFYSKLVPVQEIEDEKLRVFPNPTSNYLVIDSEQVQDEEVGVYDMDGRLVQTSKLDSGMLDVSRLNEGKYILKLANSEQRYSAVFFKM